MKSIPLHLWEWVSSTTAEPTIAREDHRTGARRTMGQHLPWSGWILLTLLFSRWVSQSWGKELKYPEGVRPGDGVSGAEGEYFRYKHVFVKPPDDEDRMEALKMAQDLKCAACEVLLKSLVQRAESFTEDHIMDQFDGEMLEPAVIGENEQENRVNQNRKGCNKHFKDELLLRGWSASSCAKVDDSEGESARWCLEQSDRLPTEREVDTYNVRSEAIFYACEGTLGRNGPEMAAKLVELKEAEAGNLSEMIRVACREAGRRASKSKRRKGKGAEL